MCASGETNAPGVATAPSSRPRASLRARVAAGLRRGLVLGTGSALAAGLAAGVAPAGPAPATDPGSLRPVASTSSAPLRTFTLNVAFPMGKWRARADMKRALTTLDASVGGFQEMSQRVDRESLIGLLRANNWGWYMPRHAGVATPVVFDRERFRLVEGTSVKVHGPEAGVTPSRFINVVKLRELSTGKIFGVINTHAISGASRDAQASNMHRIPRLRKHIRMLRDEILALHEDTEQVVAMGDLNVNYLADRRRRVWGLPTRVLGPVVNFDMPLIGSRGLRSLLDYTMSVQGGTLERTAGQVVRGFNSDHQAVVITYDVADVFTAGPLTNAPSGGSEAARVVLDHWANAIEKADPGTTVRVATRRIRDAAVTDALLAATARGVEVRVLVNRGARTGEERRLADALGGASGSWLRPAGADSQASFLLVERAGGTTNLTLSTSTPVTRRATRGLADAYQTADSAVHGAFLKTFEALAGADVSVAGRTGGAAGDLAVRFGPVADGERDPVARALAPVRCHDAASRRTRDGQTQVRVAVRGWRGPRGTALARQLRGKARWGCHVRVLAGPGVTSWIVHVLRRGGADVRRVAVSQAMLQVDGHYGRDRDAQVTWAGTHTFDERGLNRVSQTVVSRSEPTLVAYRRQFEERWRDRG